MILKSLKLENIRSYHSEVINFPEGSILLSGDIGSGKSTILLAIEFALFGTRRDGLSGPALLRKGERQGSVELNFTIDEKDITVKRVLKKGPTSVAQEAGWIIVNGVKTDLTTQEIKSKILDMLGYPAELLTKSKSLIYRYTVYTPQEQIKEIILTDTETRINILRKVFGIDKYKKKYQRTHQFI